MTAATPRRRLALSLRARLLAALIALAAIGLVVAAFVTHALLASFLLKRFDDQQASASRFVYPAVIRGGRFLEPGGPLQANRLLPTTSYAAVVDSSGAIVGEWTYNADSNVWLAPTKRQAPQLPGDTFSRTKPLSGEPNGGPGSSATRPRSRDTLRGCPPSPMRRQSSHAR